MPPRKVAHHHLADRVVRETETNNKNKNMLIKAQPKPGALLSEGAYHATLTSIAGKPTEQDPKKVQFGFKVEGAKEELTKECPFSFDEGAPLRNDAETLLGRQLTSREAADGFDLATLIGKPCQVIVAHKAAPGGRLQPTVAVVQPAAKAAA